MTELRRTTIALRGGDLPDGVTRRPAALVAAGSEVLALPTDIDGGAWLQVSACDGDVEAAAVFVDGDEHPADVVRRAGPALRVDAMGANPNDLARFDRQVRVFGHAGQLVLGALHCGVVGVGGTGSAVVEQLVRLGVGFVTVVDDDTVSETNLTRVHQSCPDDVGNTKVDVAARLANDLGTTVRPVFGRVTDRAVAMKLRTCDVVFGCSDDNAGRIVLARMAPRYLQVLIDVGVTVDVVAGRVVGAPCRVSVQEPGEPCLVCRGHVDLQAAAAELLAPEDRVARAEEGYVPGLGEPDPSVVSYTTLAASIAVAELFTRLFDLGGLEFQDLLVDPLAGRWTPLRRPASALDACTEPATIAAGDAEPFLGLSW